MSTHVILPFYGDFTKHLIALATHSQTKTILESWVKCLAFWEHYYESVKMWDVVRYGNNLQSILLLLMRIRYFSTNAKRTWCLIYVCCLILIIIKLRNKSASVPVIFFLWDQMWENSVGTCCDNIPSTGKGVIMATQIFNFSFDCNCNWVK